MTRNFFIVLLLLIINLTATAQSPIITRVLQQLHLKVEDCKEEFIGENTLHNKSNQSIVVIPKMADSSQEYFALDSYILLVDSNGEIVSQYFEDHTTNGWESDAVRLEHIEIGTTLYPVKKGVDAFAITVNYTGSSQANPYSSTTLSLFMQDKKELTCILKQYEISGYSGEWDTRCAGTSKQEVKTIEIAASATNGYHDLKIANKITNTITTLVGEDCKEHNKHSIRRTVLKFNNERYQ